MNMTVTPKVGVALPSLIGAVLCWLPVVVVEGQRAALLLTLLMPAWAALLWWSCVDRSQARVQRVGIPLVTLVLAWIIGPVFVGQGAGLLYGPVITFMGAAYAGSLFGLLALTGVLLVLATVGLYRAPRDGSLTGPGE